MNAEAARGEDDCHQMGVHYEYNINICNIVNNVGLFVNKTENKVHRAIET